MMSTAPNLRSRRTATQLHALIDVEREIRAADSSGRRKYIQEFTNAFQSYRSLLTLQQMQEMLLAADTILIGDYHALPASPRFAAQIIEQRAQRGDRPLVLGVETIFSRDQHILDEWWRREIEEAEFRRRIRFEVDWGYDWPPFYELLLTAREQAEAICGLDCMPREDLRKISTRDRHAAHKLAEIRAKHPKAVIVTVFGESHLAPQHLPSYLRSELQNDRIFTVLQNVDALYWQAAGERQERVDAVSVSDDVVCVFNSTPLEKYESYRMHLRRWDSGDNASPDLTPTVYNLIDSLANFLGIQRYSSHNTSQPKFLVDMLPEVCSSRSDEPLGRLLCRQGADQREAERMLEQVSERGCAYIAQINAFYIRDFQMMYAAEEASRFLHHACRGLPMLGRETSIMTQVGGRLGSRETRGTQRLENALAYFGSRVLYPTRSDERDEPGYELGRRLYNDYVQGKLTRSAVRRIFLTHTEKPGSADALMKRLAE